MMGRRSSKVTHLKAYRDRKARAAKAERRQHRRRKTRDPRFYLKAVIGVGALGLIGLPLAADMTLAVARPATSGEGTCRVVSVTDGDTVRLFCSPGGLINARLLGFDTPELFSPECGRERRAALAAKWGLRHAIWSAEEVRIDRQGLDRYGRTLTRVWIDGQDLAQVMIIAGHARAYGGGQRGSWCVGAQG